MHRLQELVRLYRLGTGVRERARLLAMSTRTERAYRAALAAADLLEGPPDAVPELAVLRAAVEVAKPAPSARDAPSSVDEWLDEIHRQAKAGAGLDLVQRQADGPAIEVDGVLDMAADDGQTGWLDGWS
jgi:hypothetical protein